MILENEHYLDHGWIKAPLDVLNTNESALRWLMNYDLVLYPGLNTREFNITDLDEKLTIQYDKSQPRRFQLTELYFHT
jgi:hypothetical protein